MLKIVSLCLVALVASVTALDEIVFNGNLITIDKAPYIVQVRLRRNNGYLCSGTLLTPSHVVTSRNCVDGYKPIKEFAVVGNTAGIEHYEGVLHRVSKHFAHPKREDVAVLKLATPMNYANTVPVKLCSKPIPVGAQLEHVGWDLSYGGYVSDALRTKPVTVDTFEFCKKKYHFFTLSDTVFCASETGVTETCHGNKGAPALYDGELCGIASWTQNCGQYGYPILFTDVNKVKDFILESLEQ